MVSLLMTSILTPDAASWSNERRVPCRSHMEERFCVVVTWTNTPASQPYERPCPRRALHDKNTASQISHPCERVVDSRICQHFSIAPGNSSQKTTFNLIRCTPPRNKQFCECGGPEADRNNHRPLHGQAVQPAKVHSPSYTRISDRRRR